MTTGLEHYMRELCEEHRNAGWIAGWSHLLWDAMLSDGTLDHWTTANPRKLTPDALAKLRGLFKNADCWRVHNTWASNPNAMQPIRDLCGFTLDDMNHSATLAVPVFLWEQYHDAWLRTDQGQSNRGWRNDVHTLSGTSVEALAIRRDRFVDHIERVTTTPDSVLGGDVTVRCLRDVGTQIVISWTPKDVLDRGVLHYV